MSIEITVALISLAGAALGTFGGILTASRLSNYRIEQLEKKMDKHNSLIERIALAERDIKHIISDIDELKGE